jgi:hypothetical protein
VKLWLDRNIELDLSRDAIAVVEKAIMHYMMTHSTPLVVAELITASNQIRAHLQHVLTEPPVSDEELLA